MDKTGFLGYLWILFVESILWSILITSGTPEGQSVYILGHVVLLLSFALAAPLVIGPADLFPTYRCAQNFVFFIRSGVFGFRDFLHFKSKAKTFLLHNMVFLFGLASKKGFGTVNRELLLSFEQYLNINVPNHLHYSLKRAFNLGIKYANENENIDTKFLARHINAAQGIISSYLKPSCKHTISIYAEDLLVIAAENISECKTSYSSVFHNSLIYHLCGPFVEYWSRASRKLADLNSEMIAKRLRERQAEQEWQTYRQRQQQQKSQREREEQQKKYDKNKAEWEDIFQKFTDRMSGSGERHYTFNFNEHFKKTFEDFEKTYKYTNLSAMSGLLEYFGLPTNTAPERDQVKKAYRRMVARFHPDKHASLPDNERAKLEDKTKEINLKYEQLMAHC